MIPDEVRERIRDLVWSRAEEADWEALPDPEKARLYETWTRDQSIGGILGHYMDPRRVRVYIKDSLLKPYERVRLRNTATQVLTLLGIDPDEDVVEATIKPHGRSFEDGRVVCWGKSRDWKTVLLAVYERAYRRPGCQPYAAVLLETGKTGDPAMRRMVTDVAGRLGIERLEWLD